MPPLPLTAVFADRGSKKATSTGCLHLVSAWATEARLTLGQVSVPDGSNEVAVNRTRSGHAGANLAMIRKVAVSLTRRAPGKQSGVTKRLKAGWDDDYMLQVLQGIPAVVVR